MNTHVEAALREAMDRTANSVADNPQRYDQVATRVKRRRQRRIMAGMAATALLVTGSVMLAGGRLPTADGDEPAGDPPGNSCPPPVSSVQLPASAFRQQQDTPLVREDPVAVRVCGLFDATLDRDLDRLVAALNSTSPPPEPWMCTAEVARRPYHLIFRYADGSEITAVLEQGNCRSVQVGDQVRMQSDQLIRDLVYEMAEAQRWADAPAEPPTPRCPDASTLTRPAGDLRTPPWYDAIGADPTESVPYEAVAVAVCRYDSTDPQTARLVADELVTDGAEQARALVNAQSPENSFWECEPPAGWFDVLMFADAAGGMYEVRVGRGDCKLFYSAAHLSGEPDPGLQRWLDDTLGERD